MPTTRESRLGDWALLVGSLCVALVIIEIFCRAALPRPGYIPFQKWWLPGLIQPHPTRLYQLVPNFAGVLLDTMVETNAAGMRDKSLTRLQPSTFRILAIGDSFTFGTGIQGEQAWPARLEQILSEELPNVPIAVVNAGVPGYGLAQIRDFGEELIGKLAPDLIIVGVYADGFDRLIDPYTSLSNFVVRKSKIRTLLPGDGGVIQLSEHMTSLDLWLKTHWFAGAYMFDGAYESLRRARDFFKSRENQQAGALGLSEGLEELERMNRYAGDRNIPMIALLIVDFDGSNHANPVEMATISKVKLFCEQKKIVTDDPTTMLLGARGSLRVSPEDYHWSAPAHTLVAKELAPRVLSLMAERR